MYLTPELSEENPFYKPAAIGIVISKFLLKLNFFIPGFTSAEKFILPITIK